MSELTTHQKLCYLYDFKKTGSLDKYHPYNAFNPVFDVTPEDGGTYSVTLSISESFRGYVEDRNLISTTGSTFDECVNNIYMESIK